MMRLFLRTLIALVYFISATLSHAEMLIDPFQFGVASHSITFLQCNYVSTATSPITWTGVNVGTASADRYTLVGVGLADSAATFTMTSMTIGGNTATKLVDFGGASRQVSAGFFILANPTGTSQNIVLTPSEAIAFGGTICTWQINNLTSATADATSSGGSANGALFNFNLNTLAGGLVAGMCVTFESTANTNTWAGLTERFDGEGSLAVSGADKFPTTSATPLSVSCDFTTTNQDSAGAAVSLH